ncbi:MAG: flavodoxin domain-containing protein [Caldisericota bacterium]|nr:flavodoxin domain-containing protein [Caldisericota bacterium]
MQDTQNRLRVLVLYYSMYGHARFVAEAVAVAAHADIEELHPLGEPAGSSLRRYLWAVRGTLLKKKPLLQPLAHDLSAYDLLILGSPVWMGNVAPAMRQFISRTPLQGRKVAVFCSYRSSPGPAFHAVRRALRSADIIDITGFLEPLGSSHAGIAVRARRWVRDLLAHFLPANGPGV